MLPFFYFLKNLQLWLDPACRTLVGLMLNAVLAQSTIQSACAGRDSSVTLRANAAVDPNVAPTLTARTIRLASIKSVATPVQVRAVSTLHAKSLDTILFVRAWLVTRVILTKIARRLSSHPSSPRNDQHLPSPTHKLLKVLVTNQNASSTRTAQLIWPVSIKDVRILVRVFVESMLFAKSATTIQYVRACRDTLAIPPENALLDVSIVLTW